MNENTSESLKVYALRILRELGLPANRDSFGTQYIGNQAETKVFKSYGTKVYVKVTDFSKDSRINSNCQVEVNFSLPEDAVMAETFIEHCAKRERIEKNVDGYYSLGPKYKNRNDYIANKKTEAFSPWQNRMFTVWSDKYPISEIDTAVENCIKLAKKFYNHLSEVPALKVWKTTDRETISKANAIIANAKLYEADTDRENKGHWIKDANSFFKGWFYPFNDKDKGSFDIYWPGSVEKTAGNMGVEGSEEYAIASLLLVNDEFIAKARKACRIVKETVIDEY